MIKSLINLNLKEGAIIESFEGGQTMRLRLEGMGIRPGKTILRVSTQFNRGPVIISVDGHQTAIGRGLAEKIMVRQPECNGTGMSYNGVDAKGYYSSKKGAYSTNHYENAAPRKANDESNPRETTSNLHL